MVFKGIVIVICGWWALKFFAYTIADILETFSKVIDLLEKADQSEGSETASKNSEKPF